jgi:hypothetical protein
LYLFFVLVQFFWISFLITAAATFTTTTTS